MSVLCAHITPDDIKRMPCRAETLAEAALSEPEGVYTVARTYHRDQMVLFDAHLDRLEDSARRGGTPIELNRERLRQALKGLLDAAGFADTRLRLTVPSATPQIVAVIMERLPVLPEAYLLHGVKMVSVRFARSHPRIKSNRLESLRAQVRSQMAEGAYEGLITGPRGEILEGLSSNFYAILEGEMRTADENVLHGISRKIVLEIAEHRVPVDLHPVTIADLLNASEAFMSSSSRGILPVVTVNETTIGSGKPGTMTRELIRAYDEWVEDHLEPLWQEK
jgi:branched-chain amino acid aminotransferase